MTASAQNDPVKAISAQDLSRVDQEFANAIRIGLGHFGPDSLVDTLVYILELEHAVNIDSISNDPASLKTALSRMFGGAAYVVEFKICQAIAKRLGVDGDGKSLDDLISMLKAANSEGRL